MSLHPMVFIIWNNRDWKSIPVISDTWLEAYISKDSLSQGDFP